MCIALFGGGWEDALSKDVRPIVFWRSARKHRIGRARAREVMSGAEPERVRRSGGRDPLLCWVGRDGRGLLMEVIALDLPEAVVVIHVMPVYRTRRRTYAQEK